MDAPALDLTLIPAPDDSPLKSPTCQAELQRFEQYLSSHGLEVSYTMEVRESWTPGPNLAPYLGDFTIKLVGTIGPPLIAGIAGWLHGRSGRKVRIKVGDLEVEAPTTKEVEKLLVLAQETQRTSQLKVIHEP
jgi:hypothetical protein